MAGWYWMSLGICLLQLQQDPGQHFVSSLERMANPRDEISMFMCSVTIPSQAQDLPVHRETLMSNFRNKGCPICGDWFPGNKAVKSHFISCVGRTGNPQGCYWNSALDGERRIGKKIDELYCSREGGKDQDTETSTSDSSSGDYPRTMSYEPSESAATAKPRVLPP